MNKCLALFLFFIIGCSKTSSPPEIDTAQRITGTVSYLDNITMPENTKLTLKLYDVSLMDVPAILIGESEQAFSLAAPMQVPQNFEISYLTAQIDPRHSYSVQAVITANNKMIFTSTSAYPVITRGNGKQVDIMLEPTTNVRALNDSTKIVEYSCDRNKNITVSFTSKNQKNTSKNNTPTSTAIINSKNSPAIILAAKQVGSGFLYSNGKYSLRGKGEQAQWTVGRMMPFNCAVTKNKLKQRSLM